jgi:hypothetical protein
VCIAPTALETKLLFDSHLKNKNGGRKDGGLVRLKKMRKKPKKKYK